MKKTIAFLVVLINWSCTSNQPLGSSGFNAGYANYTITDGVYYVWVQGIGGVWDSRKGMVESWHTHAESLCDNVHEKIDVRMTHYGNSLLYRVLVPKKKVDIGGDYNTPLVEGYIICNESPFANGNSNEVLSRFERGMI